jgi:hypothetical protein
MPQPSTMNYARRMATGNAAPTTQLHPFLRCTMSKTGAHVESEGIRGIRGRQAEDVVDGVYTVGGEIAVEPRPDNLDLWLQYCLGGVPTGTPAVTSPTDTLPEFFVDVDKGPKSMRYAGCKVNTAVFRSSSNQPLVLTMDVQGKTEDPTITFPSLTNASVIQPYIHHNIGLTGLTIGGVNFNPDNVEVAIDNHLLLERFLASQTRTDIPEQDRTVSLTCDFPFTSDENTLYDIAVAGLAATLKYTMGGYSLLFTFAKLQAPTIGPTIDARTGELMHRISFRARRSGSTAEVTATNDSTP